MNKGIIIGIAIAIIIGVGAIIVSGNNSSNDDKVGLEESEVRLEESEPKQFTVGLSEKVGFSENKP